MLAQRDDEHRDLDIRPRTLLVPPELQQTAKELLQCDFIQRASNDLPTGNALKNVVAWRWNRACPTRTVHRHQCQGLVPVRQPAGHGSDRGVPARQADARPSSSSASTPTPTCWPRRGGSISTTVPWPTSEPPTRPRAKPERTL